MLRICSHLVNASLFGSLAALSMTAMPTGRPLALMQDGRLAAAPAARTAPRPGAPLSASNPRLPQFAQLVPSGTASPSVAPADASAKAVSQPAAANRKGPDPVVPPIARSRPKAPPLSVNIVPPAPDVKTTIVKTTIVKRAQPGVTQSGATQSGANKSGAGGTAARKPLDGGSRSALGGPQGNGAKCATGLRYDQKQLKCVKPAPAKPQAAAPSR